jgi:hypothetical protein
MYNLTFETGVFSVCTWLLLNMLSYIIRVGNNFYCCGLRVNVPLRVLFFKITCKKTKRSVSTMRMWTSAQLQKEVLLYLI